SSSRVNSPVFSSHTSIAVRQGLKPMIAAASDPPIPFRRRRSHSALGMSLVFARTVHALILFPPSCKFVESEGGAIALFGGLERITGSIYMFLVRHVKLLAGLFKV